MTATSSSIGPDADYRKAVLAKGSLGGNEVYRDVIRESGKASAVFYVNFNAGDDWLVRLVGDGTRPSPRTSGRSPGSASPPGRTTTGRTRCVRLTTD